ncbi:hypothetical protein HHJ78_04405 [Mobiluncus mulieris]|uniref:Phage gp6-like head-tail connector protein n=1 Tax=Mobiluncus mulieris TaxID=2052 RepID=A0A7Y0Y3V8_9ACTO|nr:hypothetical protein [Mobiluncus mulieris]NMW64788.1 hypothetical protein [Mobiluncus mulieris]
MYGLAQYVQAPPVDAEFIAQCETSAVALVKKRLGDTAIPEAIMQAAVLEVGANLYNRRTSRRDIGVFGDAETQAPYQRPALDPLTPAMPILRPYLTPAIA